MESEVMEKYKEGDVLQIENQPAKVCKTCMSKIVPGEEYVPVPCNCCETLSYHHEKCLKSPIFFKIAVPMQSNLQSRNSYIRIHLCRSEQTHWPVQECSVSFFFRAASRNPSC